MIINPTKCIKGVSILQESQVVYAEGQAGLMGDGVIEPSSDRLRRDQTSGF